MIEKMNLGGCNHSEIGRTVGKSPGTIKRELGRCAPGEYTAEQAQKDVEAKRKNKYEHWLQQKDRSQKQAFRKRLTPNEKKQVEICIRMQPSVDQDTVVKITGIDKEVLSDNFERIKEQIIAM